MRGGCAGREERRGGGGDIGAAAKRTTAGVVPAVVRESDPKGIRTPVFRMKT